MNAKTQQKPDAVSRLESAYGGPSREGFGSAVFHQPAGGIGDLTQAALSIAVAMNTGRSPVHKEIEGQPVPLT